MKVDLLLNPDFELCWCEHCGHMPQGTVIFSDGGTLWCLDCTDEFKPEEALALVKLAKKIQKLQKKLELENEEEE